MYITWKQFERYWYLFSLGVIIASLPFSKLLISIGQMMLAGGWIVERFNVEKFLARLKPLPASSRILSFLPLLLTLGFKGIFSGFHQFIRHKPALIFSSVFLLHIIGLAYTTDFEYALKDLRTKFPLLLLPLILSTSKTITDREFHRYLWLLVASVFIRSVSNTWLIANHNYIDIRDVSRNVSHIIFSLLLVLSMFVLLYFLFRRFLLRGGWKILVVLLLIWFMIYLVVSQSFTGISVAFLTLLIFIPLITLKVKQRWIRIVLLGTILVITTTVFLLLRMVVNDYRHVNPVDISRLDSVTSRGNRYIHNLSSTQTENGNYMWHYIQWDEMRAGWNKRSKFPFDSLDLKNQTVAHTVVRFLTSKGWRKDGDAVDKLTDREVAAIEKGVANYIFIEDFSIRGRIYEFLSGYDQYMKTGNPTGSTVMQRIEFWKASFGIISDYWLSGVGTGDMNEAFAVQYEKMGSKLSPDQRWRSHNQFLSVWIGFGIFGLAWFLFALFSPPVIMQRTNDYFIVIILIITTLSMLTEDTIESQTGVTFFALFYSLFLFSRFPKS